MKKPDCPPKTECWCETHPNHPDCPPKSECWCETHPNHSDCITLEIDSFLWVSMIVILILIYFFRLEEK